MWSAHWSNRRPSGRQMRVKSGFSQLVGDMPTIWLRCGDWGSFQFLIFSNATGRQLSELGFLCFVAGDLTFECYFDGQSVAIGMPHGKGWKSEVG